MAVSSAAVFTLPGDNYVLSALLIGLCFSMVNLPCVSVWALFGVGIKRYLSSTRRLKIFNWTLAFLTAATVLLFYI